jgi:hypothetical protein
MVEGAIFMRCGNTAVQGISGNNWPSSDGTLSASASTPGAFLNGKLASVAAGYTAGHATNYVAYAWRTAHCTHVGQFLDSCYSDRDMSKRIGTAVTAAAQSHACCLLPVRPSEGPSLLQMGQYTVRASAFYCKSCDKMTHAWNLSAYFPWILEATGEQLHIRTTVHSILVSSRCKQAEGALASTALDCYLIRRPSYKGECSSMHSQETVPQLPSHFGNF